MVSDDHSIAIIQYGQNLQRSTAAPARCINDLLTISPLVSVTPPPSPPLGSKVQIAYKQNNLNFLTQEGTIFRFIPEAKCKVPRWGIKSTLA
jgi:hypothetical protein